MANMEASMTDGDNLSFEENVASAVSNTVTERISALVEQKFAELHPTLDKLGSRVEDKKNKRD